MTSAPTSRLEPARRRARVAKRALGAAGALAFVGALLLARAHQPGHAKSRPASLSAPPEFVRIVRENQLEAGIIGPAQAPPSAASAQS